MAELIITGMDEHVVQNLHVQAERHGRTAPEEARAILTAALSGEKTWAAADSIYHRLSISGREHSDSAELIREDRHC